MGETGTKQLSRLDLFSLAIGQIIGVGIMTMTGIAIGFTGRSVNIAYIIAGIISVIATIPQIYIGGTANFIGGQYSQIAVLSGKKAAGMFIYVQLFTSLAISLYAMSFSEYFLSIVPNVNGSVVALVVLTFLFGMHLFGVKHAAKLQNIMCVVLALGIASYVVFGVGSIEPGYFASEGFMAGGVSGFILASLYLTFASGGAVFVVNYSSVAKNPTKDIPFVIIVSTISVVVLYAIMSTIAAGVLPVEMVANQPLSVSAVEFMPSGVYTFFVVGGAMFALITTLNFNIGMIVYPVQIACKDGWLPKFLTKKNKKFDTPHLILLVFYIISIAPIVFGLDITEIANSTVILITSLRVFVIYSATKLPKVLPELWDKSNFHVSGTKLKVVCFTALIISVLSIMMLLISTATNQILLNVGFFVVAIVLSCVRNKNVTISTSYTER